MADVELPVLGDDFPHHSRDRIIRVQGSRRNLRSVNGDRCNFRSIGRNHRQGNLSVGCVRL